MTSTTMMGDNGYGEGRENGCDEDFARRKGGEKEERKEEDNDRDNVGETMTQHEQYPQQKQEQAGIETATMQGTPIAPIAPMPVHQSYIGAPPAAASGAAHREANPQHARGGVAAAAAAAEWCHTRASAADRVTCAADEWRQRRHHDRWPIAATAAI